MMPCAALWRNGRVKTIPPKSTALRYERLAPVLLLIALAYANSLHGELVFDDASVILRPDILQVKSWTDLGMIFHDGMLRPVLRATYAADYLVSGTDPYAFHVTNV